MEILFYVGMIIFGLYCLVTEDIEDVKADYPWLQTTRQLSVQSVWAMVMILMVLKGTMRWRTAHSVAVQEHKPVKTGIREDIDEILEIIL